MSLYRDLLLEACKSIALIDDFKKELDDSEVIRYFPYMKNAIARFNNNPKLSIGTDKILTTAWERDDWSFFVRLVRDADLNHLRPLTAGNYQFPERCWNGCTPWGTELEQLAQNGGSKPDQDGEYEWQKTPEVDFKPITPSDGPVRKSRWVWTREDKRISVSLSPDKFHFEFSAELNRWYDYYDGQNKGGYSLIENYFTLYIVFEDGTRINIADFPDGGRVSIKSEFLMETIPNSLTNARNEYPTVTEWDYELKLFQDSENPIPQLSNRIYNTIGARLLEMGYNVTIDANGNYVWDYGEAYNFPGEISGIIEIPEVIDVTNYSLNNEERYFWKFEMWSWDTTNKKWVFVDDKEEIIEPIKEFPYTSEARAISKLRSHNIHKASDELRGYANTTPELPELPQRMISVRSPNNLERWIICNQKDFFEASINDFVVMYEMSENEGLIRAHRPEVLTCVFDRAIPYTFGLEEIHSSMGDAANFDVVSNNPRLCSDEKVQTTFKWWDAIALYIDIPTSHIPYLINLIAYELALGLKVEETLVAQLRDQLASQEVDLYANNVRDRVKTDVILKDYSWNFWHRHAYR